MISCVPYSLSARKYGQGPSAYTGAILSSLLIDGLCKIWEDGLTGKEKSFMKYEHLSRGQFLMQMSINF